MRSAQREDAGEATVDVLIAGGGPFGLMLANELGRRGTASRRSTSSRSCAATPRRGPASRWTTGGA